MSKMFWTLEYNQRWWRCLFCTPILGRLTKIFERRGEARFNSRGSMRTGKAIWIGALSILTTVLWDVILTICAKSAGLVMSGGWLTGISLTIFTASVLGFCLLAAADGGEAQESASGQAANDNIAPAETAPCRDHVRRGLI
jgi:hypothetical protein